VHPCRRRRSPRSSCRRLIDRRSAPAHLVRLQPLESAASDDGRNRLPAHVTSPPAGVDQVPVELHEELAAGQRGQAANTVTAAKPHFKESVAFIVVLFISFYRCLRSAA